MMRTHTNKKTEISQSHISSHTLHQDVNTKNKEDVIHNTYS